MKYWRLKLFYVFIVLLFASDLHPNKKLLLKAVDLAPSDPMEADAIYEKIARESDEKKLAKAASFNLFYLRIKSNRFGEAFILAQSKSLREQWARRVAENYELSKEASENIHTLLHRACYEKKDPHALGKYFSANQVSVKLYELASDVLRRCNAKDRQKFFSELDGVIDDADSPAVRTQKLLLLAIKTHIESGEEEEAVKWLTYLDRVIEDETLQIVNQKNYLWARFYFRKSQFDKLDEYCRKIESKSENKVIERSCRFMQAFALLTVERTADALNLIHDDDIQAMEIDFRLLKLIALVKAAKVEKGELKKYMNRFSYIQCAPKLRKLAKEVLK